MNFQLLISGLSLGMCYGLVAMGMVLIYRSVGVMNFAQGNFLMFSSYICYTINRMIGLPMILSMLITIPLMGLLGIVFQKVAYWPLRNYSQKTVVVSTMGASFILSEGARIIWGPLPLTMDRLIDRVFVIAGVSIQGQYIAILIIASLVMLFVYILLEKTKVGNMMQATAQDQYMASLVGINVKSSIGLTFFLSISIAAVAGTLMSPIYFLTPGVGTLLGVKAFAAIVIGGFGSIPGAVLGGVLVGLIEAFGGTYISSTYQMAIIYVFLIIVLLVKPEGLFSSKIQEKA